MDQDSKSAQPFQGKGRIPPRMLYVLGSTRSGTSALRNAITRTRYKGYGEGHMEPMLAEIIAKPMKTAVSPSSVSAIVPAGVGPMMSPEP